MQNIDTNIEEWKDVPEYNGAYQVSSLGRVRSMDRYVTQNKGNTTYSRVMYGKVIKPRLYKNGYLMVKLSQKGKSRLHTLHRLVLSTFNPNKDCSLVVNHIDGNKLNNKLSNLEWVTHTENNNHAVKHGLIQRTSNVKVICVTTGKVYQSMTAAAKAIGVTRGAIAQAIRKKQKSKGLQWKIK